MQQAKRFMLVHVSRSSNYGVKLYSEFDIIIIVMLSYKVSVNQEMVGWRPLSTHCCKHLNSQLKSSLK